MNIFVTTLSATRDESLQLHQRGFTVIELMVVLVLAGSLLLVSIELVVNNEHKISAYRAKNTALHAAMTTSELLRRAVWNAGHTTIHAQPSRAIQILGRAPAGRLQVSYALNNTGVFLDRNCAGNSRKNGRAIAQTTDTWQVQVSDFGLSCRPSAGAGVVLEEGIAGMNFIPVQSNHRQLANGNRFSHRDSSTEGWFTRAVQVEVSIPIQGSAFYGSRSLFSWVPYSEDTSSTLDWRLIAPIAIDTQ